MDPRSVLTSSARPPDAQVRFGPAAHQVYDRYLPAPTPVADTDQGPPPARAPVVLVHGGFWRDEYDRTHLRPLAAALADRGHLVVSVEYRGTGGAASVGWEEIAEDIQSAFDHVLIDPELADQPVVLVGHSAGAQMAVWLTHQPGRADRISGVLSLGGVLDLALAEFLDLGAGAVRETFGEDGPARSPADPARLGASPVPVTIVHGSSDFQVPISVARSWRSAAGIPQRDRFVALRQTEHFGPINPEHEAFQTVAAEIDRMGDPG